MDKSGEIEALRAEQRRLRVALDRLDERVESLSRWSEPAPPPIKAVETVEPEPPIISKPAFDSLPEPPPPQPDLPPLPEPTPLPEPPRPTATAAEPRESLELRLGRVWLVRIGIVILLTGFVFLGNYAYHEYIGRLGPFGKLLLIILAGGGLCALGDWLGRRQESLKNYARVLLAGGCATLYYATYASHFVETLRVIGSPLLGGTLLLGLGAGFVALADRLRSQTLAAATVALTFYTSAINPVSGFSLFSNLVISTAAIILLARHRWVSVSFLSLVGAYGSFAFWRLQQTHTLLPAPDVEQFWPALLFPMAYWIVHTVAVMLRRVSTFDPTARPVFLTLNNAAFFALAGPVVAGTYPDAFWLSAVAFGAVLLVLAAFAARSSENEPFCDGSYLAQGLGMVFLGLFYKCTGWQEAISFALLAATLVSIGRLRHGGIYRFFAGVSALIAAGSSFSSLVEAAPHAKLTAGAVAGILAVAGFLLRRQLNSSPRCDWRVMGFTLLAGCVCLPACLDDNLHASALRILGIALTAMLASRRLGCPEIAYTAQPFALCGQCVFAIDAAIHPASSLATAMSAIFGLAFIHLWQWQKIFSLIGRRTWQALHSVIPVALALWWVSTQLPSMDRAPALALIALLALLHGWFTKTRIVSLASIPFTLATVGFTAHAIGEKEPWAAVAISLVLLTSQSLALQRMAPQHGLAQMLRIVVVALGIGMVFAYLPPEAHFLTILLAAFLFFIAACVRRAPETLLYAGALATIAALVWMSRLLTTPANAADLLGFAAIAFAQRIGKRRLAGTAWFGVEIQATLCSVATVGSWVVIHRLVEASHHGPLLTVAWSLLALAVLGIGFALRERTYRIWGLILLAAAVGRIFFVDVWQLETLFRILSFLVLGGVLLALGFLYNRHADTLRRWL